MSEKHTISLRRVAPDFIREGGPSRQSTEIPPMIAAGICLLPFRIEKNTPIASTGSRSDREVVVFKAVVSDSEEVVIKIGATYDESTHGDAFSRAKNEQASMRRFDKTPLAKYVIPMYPLIAGTQEQSYDVRVQNEYATGIHLADVDIQKLSPHAIQTLIQYHKDLLKTIVRHGIYPEAGIADQKDALIKKLTVRLFMFTPLASENVVFDACTNSLRIIDTGYIHDFSDQKKPFLLRRLKQFTALSLTLAELGILSGIQAFNKLTNKAEN